MFDFLNQNKEEGNEDVSFFEMVIKILTALWNFIQDAFSGFKGTAEG